jgi:hypothetical protein
MEEPCVNGDQPNVPTSTGGLVRGTVTLASELTRPSDSGGQYGVYREELGFCTFGDRWIEVFDSD